MRCLRLLLGVILLGVGRQRAIMRMTLRPKEYTIDHKCDETDMKAGLGGLAGECTARNTTGALTGEIMRSNKSDAHVRREQQREERLHESSECIAQERMPNQTGFCEHEDTGGDTGGIHTQSEAQSRGIQRGEIEHFDHVRGGHECIVHVTRNCAQDHWETQHPNMNT